MIQTFSSDDFTYNELDKTFRVNFQYFKYNKNGKVSKFYIESSQTGIKVMFFITKLVYDDNNVLTSWEYQPTDKSIENVPGARGTKVVFYK